MGKSLPWPWLSSLSIRKVWYGLYVIFDGIVGGSWSLCLVDTLDVHSVRNVKFHFVDLLIPTPMFHYFTSKSGALNGFENIIFFLFTSLLKSSRFRPNPYPAPEIWSWDLNWNLRPRDLEMKFGISRFRIETTDFGSGILVINLDFRDSGKRFRILIFQFGIWHLDSGWKDQIFRLL